LNRRKLTGLVVAVVGLMMFLSIFTTPDSISDAIPDSVWFWYVLVSVLFVIFGFAFFFFTLPGEQLDEVNEKIELKKYFQKKSYATYLIVAVNVIVFIAIELIRPELKNALAVSRQAVSDGRWYTILTYMFVHVNYQHIVFNMFVLLAEGSKLENVVGKMKFLAVYLTAGLAGGLLVLLFDDYSAVGASGAVYGIMGAMLVVAVINKDKMKYYLSELIVMIIAGMMESALIPQMGLSVHLIGFVVGVLFIVISKKDKYRLEASEQ